MELLKREKEVYAGKINCQIQFGSKVIDYRLEFSDRKTLGITVTPNMEVLVKAPLSSGMEKIQEKLRKKAPWILKQQQYFSAFHPKTTERKYVSGETHLYMGRQYRLKIIEDSKAGVKLKGQWIEVHTPNADQTKKLVIGWYVSRAKQKFPALSEPIIERFKKYNVAPSGLHIREMATRWGSCTSKGKIILNPELIKAPRGCIEYVITHELCHLIHHEHNRKFYELQSREMPDWEKWKGKLERLLA
ncbi:MAG: M48 family metallopeptidase [Cryomorphaceae bacterium]|nr:M48 family metallopeptidase [Cryomorphaceae bacterium]